MEILAYVIIAQLGIIIIMMYLIYDINSASHRQIYNAIFKTNEKTNKIIEDEIAGVKIVMRELN